MVQSHVFAAVGTLHGATGLTGRLGLFRQSVGAPDWRHVLPDLAAYSVLVHPQDPSRVLAGTADGVFRSTDGGATFGRARFPDRGVQVWSFLVDPANPERIFAGASPVAIYRSDDGGATWTRRPLPALPVLCTMPFQCRVMRMAAHPRRSDEIYAVLEVSGVMRSTDGGDTWSDCSAHLMQLATDVPRLRSKLQSDTEAEGMLDGHALCISPADPDGVILAVRMGLFRSRDQGRTWQDLGVGRHSPFTYGRDIRVSPHDPRTLYACLSVAAMSKDGGLFRSTDLGETWSRFDKVQPHGTLMSVSLHPRDASQVYVAARYGEVFGTQDAGATWQATPLPDVQHIYCLSCG